MSTPPLTPPPPVSQATLDAQLIAQYTPVFYLHSKEKYWPISANFMLQNSIMKDFNTKEQIASPTNRDLYDKMKKYDFQSKLDGDLVLYMPPYMFRGQTDLSNIPVYAFLRRQDGKTYIHYIAIFAYNGEYEIADFGTAGAHPGDLEQLMVELNDKNELVRVFYGSHGLLDGRWVAAKDVERTTSGNKIVAYVALNGHGLYPHEGVAFRLYGIANDHLDKGFLWEPKAVQIFTRDNPSFDIDTMGWTVWNGRLGADGLDAPSTAGLTGLPDKNWFRQLISLNESEYKPPSIIQNKVFKAAKTFGTFMQFVFIYILVFIVLFIVDKVVDTSKSFSLLEHSITVLLVLFLYYLYYRVGVYFVNKYAPH